MKYNKLIIFLIGFIFPAILFSQSKKDIRNNKIVSETSNVTIFENGKEVTYKDSFTTYDKNGNVIERIEFYKDGKIKHKETSKYSSNKNKIEIIEYDDKDKITIKTTFVYDNNDNKILETEYQNGKLVKQTAYVYNNKGFKTERRVVDENKKLINIKKYIYSTK